MASLGLSGAQKPLPKRPKHIAIKGKHLERFSDESVKSIILSYLRKEKTVSELAKEAGVKYACVYNWVTGVNRHHLLRELER